MGTFRVARSICPRPRILLYLPLPLNGLVVYAVPYCTYRSRLLLSLRRPAADAHYHLLPHACRQELDEVCEKKAHGKSHWARFHDQCHTGDVLISCRCRRQASQPHFTGSVIATIRNAVPSYTNVFPDARSFEISVVIPLSLFAYSMSCAPTR